jgi:hypothetical protein
MATKKPFSVKHGLEVSGNTTATGSILPSSNNVYDLGSEEMVWRDVYIGPGSLYVNGQKVIEDDSNTIVVKADADQSLTLKTTGTGETTLQSQSGVNITGTGTSDVQITAGGNIEMKSPVQIQSGERITDSAGINVEFGDNIAMNSNKITGLGAPTADSDAATKAYVDSEVSDFVNAAPGALDTLNELAAALGDDANFATTVSTNLGQKLGATASVTLTGDVSGSGSFSSNAVSITTTIADDSHNHVISNVDGLQAALDSKATEADSAARLANTNAYIATKLNSSSYTAADVLSKITTVDGATSGLDADLLDGQHGSYYRSWDNATNKPSPTVTISGDVSGSATLTELGNATIVATIADDSHNHVISNVDGLQTALDSKLAASSYTASDVLTKIKTVDGVGSGLDADLLDGQSGSYYTNYTDTAITNLIGGAPGALDTLNELAAAINDDASYASSITTALAGKLNTTHDMSLTLSGDVSGSATFTNMGNATLSVTVADDSHNHVISNIDGLQSALDGKTATSRSITAGTGLNGGGNFTANRTINLNSDLRAWGTGTDVYWGNTHDYVFADADIGLRFYTAGAEDMRLQDGGNLHVDGDVIAYSTTISDERLKENVEVVSDAVSKVQQLRGVTFTYKKDGRESAGIIAQDVEKVLPQAVTEMELPFKAPEGEEYKTVCYDALHALLIESIKELKSEIEELKAKS